MYAFVHFDYDVKQINMLQNKSYASVVQERWREDG